MSYGLPNGSQIGYGAPGFPQWLGRIADAAGGATNTVRPLTPVSDISRRRASVDATPSNSRKCSKGGCDRSHYARGLCELHYQRLRAGSEFSPLQRATSLERFWTKVDTSGGPESCWQWTATKNAAGYGKFWWDGRKGYAHRAAYEFAKGPIEPGQQVDHLCYNHGCCNPAHLRLATHKQNQENRRGAQSNNSTSGVRGVRGSHGRWIAQIRHNRQTIRLGTFATIKEAAEVVRLKRLELFTHSDMDRAG